VGFLLFSLKETPLFSTLEEATELNSDCAFCKKPKFKVKPMYLLGELVSYSLDRCHDSTCKNHCEWGHDYERVALDIYGEDAQEIASGWGTH
jgi:hypothetical protein